MNKIQANIAAVDSAMAALIAHPMCVKFTDDGERFLMSVPEGFRIGAIRANYTIKGKAWALGRMIEIAEREWLESYPDPKRFAK